MGKPGAGISNRTASIKYAIYLSPSEVSSLDLVEPGSNLGQKKLSFVKNADVAAMPA